MASLRLVPKLLGCYGFCGVYILKILALTPSTTLSLTHTHTHTRAHTHTHSHIHSHSHTHTHKHTHPLIHSRSHTHSHIHTHTQLLSHTQTQTHTHARARGLTQIHTLTHTYTFTHIHTHTHTNTNAHITTSWREKICGFPTYVYTINRADYWQCWLQSQDISNRSTRKPLQLSWLLDLSARAGDKYFRVWDVFIRSKVGNSQQVEVKVKVNFTVGQAMKVHSGNGGIALLFL
jgi:hypothetical protein